MSSALQELGLGLMVHFPEVPLVGLVRAHGYGGRCSAPTGAKRRPG
jgi:hypothetical protein